jgi:hypothetical protein
VTHNHDPHYSGSKVGTAAPNLADMLLNHVRYMQKRSAVRKSDARTPG